MRWSAAHDGLFVRLRSAAGARDETEEGEAEDPNRDASEHVGFFESEFRSGCGILSSASRRLRGLASEWRAARRSPQWFTMVNGSPKEKSSTSRSTSDHRKPVGEKPLQA